MNRQQRRLAARRAEQERAFEEKYAKQIERNQRRIDDHFIKLYVICIGLALYDLYGYMPKRIIKVIKAFNKRICSIDGETVTFDTLAKELCDKTGLQFFMADHPDEIVS